MGGPPLISWVLLAIALVLVVAQQVLFGTRGKSSSSEEPKSHRRIFQWIQRYPILGIALLLVLMGIAFGLSSLF